MQREDLLQQLGLTPAASSTDIRDAIAAEREQLQSKHSSAPTDALKAKYQSMLDQLVQAEKILAEPVASKSRFSQTQLDDMPQSATQFESGNQAQMNIAVGTVLANRYEIKEQIGLGGMGAVYRAFDKNRNADIAIKIMLPSLTSNERARERFLNEARLSSQLSHPNIVNVFDVQQDGDLCFLTMELLEGQDLRQLMDNRKLVRQNFSEAEMLQLMVQLCAALGYAHKHTVHRDIKPENIWVTEDGDYKIMDFGIAQMQSTSQRTKTGAAMGTAYYMAPEQLKGSKQIDGRADIYALAVMLYELSTYDVPAGIIKPLRDIRKDLSKAFAQGVMNSLHSNPDDRPANSALFLASLTSKSGASLPSLPWPKLGLAAGVLVAVIGVGALASSGALNFAALKSLLPQSQEDLSQQKAELAKLLGQINVTKKRLEEARRKLENEVRDAERDKTNTSRLAELTHWQTLTESALFNGTQITELEGELAMAEAFNRDGSLTQAKTSYEKVLTGYTGLLDEFTSAEFLQNAAEASAKAKQDWLTLKAEFKLEDPQAVADATTQEQSAKSEEQQSHFKAALVKWREAKTSWDSVPNTFGERIANAKKEKAASELVAANELKQRQQQAAAAAVAAEAEGKRKADEAQQQKAAQLAPGLVMVNIPGKSFKMSKTEATFAQYDAYAEDAGVTKPNDEGWGRGNRPVINVSWDEAVAYAKWLSEKTGKHYRLPTEEEWEYAARAGTTTRYPWGDTASHSYANYGEELSYCCVGLASGADQWINTAPVGQFPSNGFGLYDMIGNVWEWTQSCDDTSCGVRVLRGGSWRSYPGDLRSDSRGRIKASSRMSYHGFRLVQD